MLSKKHIQQLEQIPIIRHPGFVYFKFRNLTIKECFWYHSTPFFSMNAIVEMMHPDQKELAFYLLSQNLEHFRVELCIRIADQNGKPVFFAFNPIGTLHIIAEFMIYGLKCNFDLIDFTLLTHAHYNNEIKQCVTQEEKIKIAQEAFKNLTPGRKTEKLLAIAKDVHVSLSTIKKWHILFTEKGYIGI